MDLTKKRTCNFVSQLPGATNLKGLERKPADAQMKTLKQVQLEVQKQQLKVIKIVRKLNPRESSPHSPTVW